MGLIGDIVKAIVDFVFQGIYDAVYGLIDGLLGLFVDLLAYNPPIDSVYGVWSDVTGMMTTLYVLVFCLAGIWLALGTIMDRDPDRLIREWVVKSFAGLILVRASWEIYELILGLEEAMVKEIFVNVDLTGFIVAGAVSIIILWIDLAFLLGAVLLMIIRHIIVLAGAVFFPVIIFLYMFHPTRRMGHVFLTLLLTAIFIPFAQALLLRTAMASFDAMSPSFGGLFNAVFGIGIIALLFIAPLATLGVGFSIGGMFVTAPSPRHTINRIVAKVKVVRSEISSRRRSKETPDYIG